jgi:hypothetical protein
MEFTEHRGTFRMATKSNFWIWVEDHPLMAGFLFLVALAIVLSMFGENNPPHEHDTQQETHSTPAAMPQPESETSHSGSQWVTFTSSSNGYDWRRADYGNKQAYCEMMATTMSRKFHRTFTAGFFYSSIDEFYATDNTSALNTKVNEIVALTVTAAMNGDQ